MPPKSLVRIIVFVIKAMVPIFRKPEYCNCSSKASYALEQYSNCKLNSWNIMKHYNITKQINPNLSNCIDKAGHVTGREQIT